MVRTRRATRRFLATVLFTDIVGSTEVTTRLGDAGWRALVERHHAIVRHRLRVFHGREMDTAGDGFFAVFSTPADGVRCAAGLNAALAPLGIEIRAGLHTGECEVVGGKVGGLAVNIGARVAALAEAGQVLVTSSVRDMSLGSGLQFEACEERQLKGISEAVTLFRLVSEAVDEDGAVARRAVAVPLWTRRNRNRFVATVALLALVVAGVVLGMTRLRGSPTVIVPGDAVGVLSEDGESATAAIPVGQRPNDIAQGFGAAWVTNSTGNTVSRIDLESHDVIPVHVGEAPTGVAVGAGAVWVANSGDATVSRVDPLTYDVTTVPLRSGPSDVVVAAGSVWVTSPFDASVVQIDTRRNVVVHSVQVGAGPGGIAYGGGLVWVANQTEGTVSPIDPSSRTVDAPIHVGNAPANVAVGSGAVWVTNDVDGSVSRIDLSDRSVSSRRISASGGAYGVAVDGPDVWVSSEFGGTLSRVQASSLDLIDTVRTGDSPLGLAFVDGRLWFTTSGGGAEHRGGVLTLNTTREFDDEGQKTIDPGRTYDLLTWELLSITNDGLVGWRRVGGVRGGQLVGDLATSLPSPSDDGRTYVFHLRRGIRYSTGQPVLASDIRHGLERTLRSGVVSFFYGSITGAETCVEGGERCDLSRGVVTDDRAGTVTFHLVRPDAELLYKLALPGAYALPPSVGLNLDEQHDLPATGPYRLVTYDLPTMDKTGTPTEAGRVVLVRNPRFHAWSYAAQPPGYPERIVVDVGVGPAESLRRVEAAKADLLLDVPFAEQPALPGRLSSRRHVNPARATKYVFLNTSRPPFHNRAARQAVAYALDRGAMAGDLKSYALGQVTCQLLPPNFEAHSTYCPYSLGDDEETEWQAPDLAAGQRLVAQSGTRGARVDVFAVDSPPIRVAARQVVDALDTLGYRASIRLYDGQDPIGFLRQPKSRVQVGLFGWSADYPAASNFISILAGCGPESLNLSHDCALRRQIQHALDIQTKTPGGASRLWADLDRELVDRASIIPISNSELEDFTSRRVGNYQYHPQFGALISQLWVR